MYFRGSFTYSLVIVKRMSLIKRMSFSLFIFCHSIFTLPLKSVTWKTYKIEKLVHLRNRQVFITLIFTVKILILHVNFSPFSSPTYFSISCYFFSFFFSSPFSLLYLPLSFPLLSCSSSYLPLSSFVVNKILSSLSILNNLSPQINPSPFSSPISNLCSYVRKCFSKWYIFRTLRLCLVHYFL